MQRYVEVELDRRRRFRFDWDALCDLQARLGNAPALDILERLGRLDLHAIRVAAWYGLRWEDRDLTQEQVFKILQARIDGDYGLDSIALPLAKALSLGAGIRKAETNGGDPGKAEGSPPGA